MRNTVAIVTLLTGFGIVNMAPPAMAVQPTTLPRDGVEKNTQAYPGPFWKTQRGASNSIEKSEERKSNPALLKKKNGRGGLAEKQTVKSKIPSATFPPVDGSDGKGSAPGARSSQN